MKKGIRYQLVMMLLTGFLVMCACTEISAQTNKVTYTLEDDGTMTISGKGEMPESDLLRLLEIRKSTEGGQGVDKTKK